MATDLSSDSFQLGQQNVRTRTFEDNPMSLLVERGRPDLRAKVSVQQRGATIYVIALSLAYCGLL